MTEAEGKYRGWRSVAELSCGMFSWDSSTSTEYNALSKNDTRGGAFA